MPGVDYVDGWVPTAGIAFPPTAYTAVPGATELWIDVSSVLYMPLEEMGDPTFVRDEATRAQIELVAVENLLSQRLLLLTALPHLDAPCERQPPRQRHPTRPDRRRAEECGVEHAKRSLR